jgi:hypothetical protein
LGYLWVDRDADQRRPEVAQPLQQPEQLRLVADLGRQVGLARQHGDLALGKGRAEQGPELAPHDDAPDPSAAGGGGVRSIALHVHPSLL